LNGNERRAPLRETGLLPHLYKFFTLIGEWLIKPVFNLDPPEVAMHVRDIPYVKGRPDKKQRLDVVLPLGEGPFPVLVFVHGGGFVSMDKGHYTRIAKSLASAGFLVLNVNYRRGPLFRFPANLHDVGSAVAWGLANARAYRGDPSRVFLAGDSAGAHLVSTYATALDDHELRQAFRLKGIAVPDRIRGLLLFYGVYDCETVLDTGFPFVRMMLEAFLSRDPVLFKKRAELASPIRHITPRYPPCFITWADKDKLAGESVAFGRELEARGVEHEMLSFPPGECRFIPHGYLSLFWRRSAKRAMEAAKKFLLKH
jgi:acetyl esterase